MIKDLSPENHTPQNQFSSLLQEENKDKQVDSKMVIRKMKVRFIYNVPYDTNYKGEYLITPLMPRKVIKIISF